jgi:uncharacterized protein YdeI (YjbR/CyaY-like superfamily)
VSPINVSLAISIATAADFDRWLALHGRAERSVVVAIRNKASGRQTVTLVELQEVALCHGWVDTQTKGIDDGRYAIRFVPRRPGSNWSPKNRRMAARLLLEGRITEAGAATLPSDLRRPTSSGDESEPPPADS